MVPGGYWKYQGEHFVKYMIIYYAMHLIQNNIGCKLSLKNKIKENAVLNVSHSYSFEI